MLPSELCLYCTVLYSRWSMCAFALVLSITQAGYWHDPLRETLYAQKSVFLADINQEQVCGTQTQMPLCFLVPALNSSLEHSCDDLLFSSHLFYSYLISYHLIFSFLFYSRRALSPSTGRIWRVCAAWCSSCSSTTQWSSRKRARHVQCVCTRARALLLTLLCFCSLYWRHATCLPAVLSCVLIHIQYCTQSHMITQSHLLSSCVHSSGSASTRRIRRASCTRCRRATSTNRHVTPSNRLLYEYRVQCSYPSSWTYEHSGTCIQVAQQLNNVLVCSHRT